MRSSVPSLVLCLLATPAMAHVSIAPTSVQPGTRLTAQFRIGHGCSDAAPVSTALQVEVPPAVTAVDATAPPGWSVAVVRAGNRVSAVTWKGGEVRAGQAILFPLAFTLPRNEGVLAFPAVQFCGAEKAAWTELPRGAEKLTHPAPLLTVAAAAPAAPANLTVADAWFRALPAKLPAGGYFTLRNGGSQKAVLTGAESAACGSLMLHQSSATGGMSSMGHVMSVDVPAGGSLAFAPAGYHLMCNEPKATIKPGASVPVTLLFQGGGRLTTNFAVRNAAGK